MEEHRLSGLGRRGPCGEEVALMLDLMKSLPVGVGGGTGQPSQQYCEFERFPLVVVARELWLLPRMRGVPTRGRAATALSCQLHAASSFSVFTPSPSDIHLFIHLRK